MKMIVMATTALGHFFRAGRKWTKDGTLLSEGDLTDKGIEALMGEPNLHVRPATDADIARLTPDLPQMNDEDVVDHLVTAISGLADDAFGKTGVPDLKKLRGVVSIDPDLVTSAARDEALTRLKEKGFQAPVKAGG